jgi:hypothetical protein
MRFSVTGTAAAQHKEFVTGAFHPSIKALNPRQITMRYRCVQCPELAAGITWTASGDVLSASDDKTVCKWTASGDCGGEVLQQKNPFICCNLKPVDMLQHQTR